MQTLTELEVNDPKKFIKGQDEPITLQNATVVVVTPGENWGFQGEPKDKPSWNIILQDEGAPAPVTVVCNQAKVGDEVKTGAVVGKFVYKRTNKNGSVRDTVKFGKPYTGGSGGGGSSYRGKSPEELLLARKEFMSRLCSTKLSYAYTMVGLNPPDGDVVAQADKAMEIADKYIAWEMAYIAEVK